jgi:hypothetical protein
MWLSGAPERGLFRVQPFNSSASTVRGYATCPRQLFYDRILGIRDDESIFMTLGKLFHKLLEEIGAAYSTRKEIEDQLTDAKIDRLVDTICDNQTELGGEESIVNVSTRDYLSELGRQFREIERHRLDDYTIDDTESDASFERNSLKFSGKIDRVDTVDGRHVVIDFKTAGDFLRTAKTMKRHLLEETGKTSYWQIPMYCYSLHERSGRWPRAFCYYAFTQKHGPFVVGLFVDDGTGAPAAFYDDKPARFDSISPEEIETLMGRAEAITRELFSERTVFQRTDDQNECKRCYFSRLCMRNEP